MILKNSLNDIFGSRSKTDIIRLLAGGKSFSGTQIATQLGMGVWACHRSLRELVNNGILLLMNMGKSYLYRLDTGNYLSKILITLFNQERLALKSYLDEALGEIRPLLVSAILFGSVARGDEVPYSGVDLLLIAKTDEAVREAREKLARKKIPLLRQYGNLLVPYFATPTLIGHLVKKESPFLLKIKKEGVVLWGKSLEELQANETGS